MRIVDAVFKPASVARLGVESPSDAIVVPVALWETESAALNRLPHAPALPVEEEPGAEARAGIVQTDERRHTGAGLTERMVNRPRFAGPVEPGRRYVPVDDVVTWGSTPMDLAGHIWANGGTVAGAIALAASRGSTILKVRPETLRRLREKHGGQEARFREAFGYGFDSLTEREACDLARAGDEAVERIVVGRDAARGIDARRREGDGPRQAAPRRQDPRVDAAAPPRPAPGDTLPEDGTLLRVRPIVNETAAGDFVYDSHAAVVERNGPDVVATGTPAPGRLRPAIGPSGPAVRVGELLAGVNYDDGTPVVAGAGWDGNPDDAMEARGGGAGANYVGLHPQGETDAPRRKDRPVSREQALREPEPGAPGLDLSRVRPRALAARVGRAIDALPNFGIAQENITRHTGAVTLAASRGSTILKLRPETLRRLGEKLGGQEARFREAFGHGFDALTEREACDLARARGHTLDRIVAGRERTGDAGGGRADATAPRGQDPELEGDTLPDAGGLETTARHGSPHRFDEFSTEFIVTAERHRTGGIRISQPKH